MEELSTYPTDLKLYEKLRIIGRGSFGKVWEAKIKLGPHKNECVAIKEVDLEELGDKNLDNLSKEITIMSSIYNEYLIRTYTTCTCGHKIDLVMPLMDYGIKDVSIIATIMKCCLEGLICLNKNNLFHRDIKAGNILLSNDGSIKLGDFGVASCIKRGAKKNSVVGSVNWMAPEVVRRDNYDEKIDIWSLGITALEIAQRNPPFYGISTYEIMREIAFGDPINQLKNQNSYDPSFVEFVKSCLVKDSKIRPGAEEVLNTNKKFFAFAKDKNFIKKTLLEGIPSVDERFEKGIVCFTNDAKENEQEAKDYENFVEWNFDVLTQSDLNDKLNENNLNSNIANISSSTNPNNLQLKSSEKNSSNHMSKFKELLGDDEMY